VGEMLCVFFGGGGGGGRGREGREGGEGGEGGGGGGARGEGHTCVRGYVRACVLRACVRARVV
jgi:hypothetical protein